VNDLAQQRDSISAVSLDEEGANLLIYEKAFQANARVMNAMDEVLDTIINRMGLVGR
jgi:flagellar hook-associated protein 1 FlgK